MSERFYAVIFLLLSLLATQTLAQDNMKQAQAVFEFIKAGQGDSIYVRMNERIQKDITPEFWSGTFGQLESQLGKYQSQGEWYTETMQEQVFHCSNVQFERVTLKFLMAFDADGKANTIRFNMLSAAEKIAVTPIPDNLSIKEEPIKIISGDYMLPGTLTLPEEIENPPVAILIHGSGPNDRDETIGPNKPFRDLAWGLAGKGIAVVRYDKRTLVYGSLSAPNGKMDYDEETVIDAIAAVEMIHNHKLLAHSDIYIIGHSLGAMLAPRIAALEPGLAGIVMIAGNARPLEDLLPEQIAYLNSLNDHSKTAEGQLNALKKQVANVKLLGTDKFDENIPLPMSIPQGYWEFSNNYKQVEVAQSLSLPMLLLQGERDYQVTMADFELWQEALKNSENATFKSYPKLNHLLQEGEGKSVPNEYSMENPVAIYVITDIADWITNRMIN